MRKTFTWLGLPFLVACTGSEKHYGPCYCGEIVERIHNQQASEVRFNNEAMVLELSVRNNCSGNLYVFEHIHHPTNTLDPPEVGEQRCSTTVDTNRIRHYHSW